MEVVVLARRQVGLLGRTYVLPHYFVHFLLVGLGALRDPRFLRRGPRGFGSGSRPVSNGALSCVDTRLRAEPLLRELRVEHGFVGRRLGLLRKIAEVPHRPGGLLIRRVRLDAVDELLGELLADYLGVLEGSLFLAGGGGLLWV